LLFVQAQRALGEVVRAAVTLSRRPLTGIVGPWAQVEASVAALAIPVRLRAGGKKQALMTLNVAKLQEPELIKKNKARHRPATPADIEDLVAMRAARDAKFLGVPDSAAHRGVLRATLEQQIAARGLFVADTVDSNHPAAMAAIEVSLPDSVQIGNVCALPTAKNRKDKGREEKDIASVAVAGAVADVLARGIKRVILLADRESDNDLAGFRALGFTAIDDFGLFKIKPAEPPAGS
jgi:predicted GNAT family acetyltransferase